MPEEFLEKKLKNLIDIRSGYTWGKEQESSNPVEGSVRVLTVSNIQQELDLSSELYLMNVSEKEKLEKKAERGWSIAVGSNGNRKRIGNAVYINNDDEYLFASFLVGFKPKPESGLHPRYFYQWLTSYPVQERITVVSEGTTGLGNLNIRHFRNMGIQYPKKYSEQEAIVKIFETLDEALKATQKSIAQAQQLKRALMQNLLSGRLKPDGTWRKPDEFYVDENFGRVPKGWTTPRVKEFVDFLRRGRSPEYTESSIYVPVINQKCIEWDRINFDYVKHHDLQVKVPDEFFLLDQDILVNSTGTGTIGRIAMFHNYDYPCFADGHVTIIRTSRKVVQPRFLKYYLMSYNGQRHLESFCYSGSTNQIELSRSYFLNMRVPMPENPDEQTAICDKIELSQKYIECSERKINRLQRLKKSLMQNLLTGKIRVQAE